MVTYFVDEKSTIAIAEFVDKKLKGCYMFDKCPWHLLRCYHNTSDTRSNNSPGGRVRKRCSTQDSQLFHICITRVSDYPESA